MRLRFLTCDVFTDRRFGGNPLAVLPDARGLTAQQMQQVAREFNYSESTFVLPPQRGGERRVRIFTPSREVPFAGHPNVGTAFVLAHLGELGPIDGRRTVVFEEAAGDVPVEVRDLGDGRYACELQAPEPLSFGPALPVEAVAAGVGLLPEDVVTDRHPPQVASVGLAFVVAEVRDRAALARSRPDQAALGRLVEAGAATPDVHLYVRTPGDPEGFDLHTRMFAPFDGVPEDPATGSANAALAGLLATLDGAADGAFAWRIGQGAEMGRPSVLEARAEKRSGALSGVWIGGQSVAVSEGWIEV